MKKMLHILWLPLLVAMFVAASGAYADVKVVFIVNTATLPDTLHSNAVVQVRGSVAPLTWDGTTGAVFTNIGGDYWIDTVSFPAGSTIAFKIFCVNWEANLAQSGGNRELILGNNDTTLPVIFYNNLGTNPDQYFRPWPTPTPDTMEHIYFRVNMEGVIDAGSFGFNNLTDTVAVRGGTSNGGNAVGQLNWGSSTYLSSEFAAANGGMTYNHPGDFWSGSISVPKSSVTEGDSVDYKFLIGYTWGRDERQGRSNRRFYIPVGKKDTTLEWVFYNDESPIARNNSDTVIVTYRVDMTTALQGAGFKNGDTVQVQTGFFGTASNLSAATRSLKILQRAGISNIYTATDTIITALNTPFDYEYDVVVNGTTNRENYYNFYYSGSTINEAEKRQATATTKTITVYDTSRSASVAHRQPEFPSVTPSVRQVTVLYTVDVRPPIYSLKWAHDTLYANNIFTSVVSSGDSIIPAGVIINGPAI